MAAASFEAEPRTWARDTARMESTAPPAARPMISTTIMISMSVIPRWPRWPRWPRRVLRCSIWRCSERRRGRSGRGLIVMHRRGKLLPLARLLLLDPPLHVVGRALLLVLARRPDVGAVGHLVARALELEGLAPRVGCRLGEVLAR